GPHRLLDRVGAEGLDDSVHALPTRQLAHHLTPLWRGSVVEDVLGAEGTEPLELAVAGRERDDAAAEELRELDREERDAARSQREHALARHHRLRPHERIPGGDTGAREGGRLLP